MKILIISAYFPPGNAIGSVRVGKFARYLEKHNCEVRVVSAIDRSLSQTLPLEIPLDHIISLDWLDINAIPKNLIGTKNQLNNRAYNPAKANKWHDIYRNLFHWPDRHMGWFFPARNSARRIVSEWRPDLIYASAWPITSLLIGASISREFSIPWVAELRDLWVDNHYNKSSSWRRWLDVSIERRTLSSSSLIVTVSEPLSEIIQKKYKVPVETILNGYDEEDLNFIPIKSQSELLTITYTGMIYPGRRDPTPLFKALLQLGPLAQFVRVHFYGRLLPGIQSLIDQYGLNKSIEVHDAIPHDRALRVQSESDVLLMLTWDTPEESGVYTGKLFEYFGARRPILFLGNEKCVGANLVRDRNAGFVSNDPTLIAGKIAYWLEEKKRQGKLSDLDKSANAGLSRSEQFSKLMPRLYEISKKTKSKRKIIFVTNKLDVGGTEQHLLMILPYLNDSFDVSIFLLNSGGSLVGQMMDRGISIYQPPAKLGVLPGQVYIMMAMILTLIKNRNSFVHFFLPKAYLIGGICAVLCRHRWIIMSRRSMNFYHEKHPILAHLEKSLHKYACAIIGNSQAVVRDLISEGVHKDKVNLIYNGVNIYPYQDKLYRDKLRDIYGINSDELVIIMVANLIKYKGHEDLIKALSIFSKQFPDPWRLILIGRDEGLKLPLCELIDTLRLKEKILFLGELKSAEHLVSIGDIGVSASHEEGFSNSILEGMAAGLPMVVTDVGGNSEAVLDHETGLVVPPHSPLHLAAALLTLAIDPQMRQDLGRSARKRVQDVFSVEACINAYKNLYHSLG